jgi:hypothetical protein
MVERRDFIVKLGRITMEALMTRGRVRIFTMPVTDLVSKEEVYDLGAV